MSRASILAALALSAVFTPTALAVDGASVTQHYEPADGRVHTDVTVNYYGGGGSQYTSYIGMGTVRVTLPQPAGVTLPTFAENPADPTPLGCTIEKGAYEQDGTRFICNFSGERH